MSNDNAKTGITPPEIRAARAIAQCYRAETLAEWAKAVDTAMDDSIHFARDSDDNGAERRAECEALAQIANMIRRAMEATR